MRLLHVVPTYLPATRYGGPIYAVHGLCRSLVERGHQVDVATTNADGNGQSDVPLGVPVDLDGVRIHYFPTAPLPGARRLYFSPGLRGFLQQHVSSYDLLHLHSVFLWPTWAAARSAHLRQIPYIVSPRGMLVPELIERKSRAVKRLWLRTIERKTFARAAAIHFTAPRERDDAARTGLPLPSPFIVPNGIDLPALEPTSRRTRTLLFLGRINWKKGLDVLIDAMALLPEARLIVAGNDEESLLPRLREQARRNGSAERIDFAGEVRGDAKRQLLETAAALVLPSHSENFGNVVLEAMAAATPVIVSPQVGLADAVAESHAGLVAERTPAAFASAIRQILHDADQAEHMGLRGRELVERRYTWARVAEEMERHYLELTARRLGR